MNIISGDHQVIRLQRKEKSLVAAYYEKLLKVKVKRQIKQNQNEKVQSVSFTFKRCSKIELFTMEKT